MIRAFGAIAAVLLLALGLALGLRAALSTASERQVQAALSRSRPFLAEVGAQLFQLAGPAESIAPHGSAMAGAALEAAEILGAAAAAPLAPGTVGAQAVVAQQSLASLSTRLAALAEASRQPVSRSSLFRLAVGVASDLDSLEREYLAQRGLRFEVPEQLSPAALEAAWLEAWSQDLREVDAAVNRRAQDWLAWQQQELPTLIREDRWEHLDRQATSDLEAVARLQERFETLAPPARATEAASIYQDALAALQAAHRHLANYLDGKASVSRELRLSGEALARYESSRSEALRRVEALLSRRATEVPRP